MPKTLLWNNPLLPEKVKQQLVQNYLCQYDSSASVKSRLKHWLLSRFVSDEYHLLQNYLFQTGKTKSDNVAREAQQKIINEMPLDRKYPALNNLLKWGFDAHFNYVNNNHTPASQNHRLLSHEVIHNYLDGYTDEYEAQKMLGIIFSSSQTLASREEQHKTLFVSEEIIRFFNRVFHLTTEVCPVSYMMGESDVVKSEHDLTSATDKLKKTCIETFSLIESMSSSMYAFIINEKNLGNQEKAIADYVSFKKHLHHYQNLSYLRWSNTPASSPMVDEKTRLLCKIQNILGRDWIFTNKAMSYHILKEVFASEELMDELSNHTIFKCYQEFENLDESLKKSLTADLLLKKREIVIFNLLAHGLNLNWMIKLKDKENVVALEVLSSIPMIKMVLSSRNFNIRISNAQGENILHLLGTLPLMDDEIRQLLNTRLEELSESERHHLFYQITDKNLTPLMKAIEYKEEVLVEYLMSWNIDVWETIAGTDKPYSSVMEFLDTALLSAQYQGIAQEVAKNLNISLAEEPDDYYYYLSRKLNSEHHYHYLNDILPENHFDEEEKIHKI